MNADKREFYRIAAKRFAASTFIYKVDSLVHVEDEDDIWFWRQILSGFRPGKYKFLPGSNNEKSKHTTGCVQCLKYRDFLSQRFFICIDSDLRYLLGEDINATLGILQTYTYSWENHCCFAERLQLEFARQTGKGNDFDFRVFLKDFSEIIFRPFLLMLYCESHGIANFDREKFKQLISLQYKKNDEKNNGRNLLKRLDEELNPVVLPMLQELTVNFDIEQAKYLDKGMNSGNVYLYIRGHALYNLVNSIGTKICEGAGVDFEQNILRSTLSFYGYEAMDKIGKDVAILNTIRSSFN